MRTPAILLVDDDAVFRERMARALAARGARVVTAGDSVVARAHWEMETLEGAILDLRLLQSSGLELIPALKVRQPRARIVVLTGFGSLATAMEAGRLGATEYLTKPVDVDRLLAAVRGLSDSPCLPQHQDPDLLSLDSVEWEHIQRVLTDCGGNISRTARLLRIDRRSLQRKLAKNPPVS